MAVFRSLLLYLGVPVVFCVLISWYGTRHSDASDNWVFATLPFVLPFGVVVSGLLYLAGVAYKFIYEPFDFFSNEGRDNYFIEKGHSGMTREEAIADMKRSRTVGEIPPVYPNGWYPVCRSTDVKTKETIYAHVLGLNLAVFRGESGQSYIVDAYCPHLGANLAVGGKVEGDCIECPFHGWRYRGEDGKCVKIGYADKVPNFIKLPTYRCLEINDLIMLWYHAEGEEPSWYPPVFDAIKSGKWVRDGGWEALIDCHVQDFVENGGDAPHLGYVHAPQVFEKVYKGHWEVHPTEGHRSASISEYTAVKPVWWNPDTTVKYRQDMYGPGLSYIEFEPADVGLMFIGCVPVGPLKQKVIFSQYSIGSINPFKRLFKRLKLYFSFVVVKGDLFIWANKTYRMKPPFIKEDHLIAKHRKWFSQFYTEHSPRFRPRDPLEW